MYMFNLDSKWKWLSPFILHLVSGTNMNHFDLSSMKSIVFGGTAITSCVADRLKEIYPNILFRQAYGLIETSSISHLQQTDKSFHKSGSVGVPIPNTEYKIVDLQTNQNVGVNTKGEIYIRGPHITRGYLNNPKATAEVLTPDGWLKSVDIGYFDQDLNLFIVERIKEMMKTKYGRTIYPSEIEDVLSSHPEVLESCVIGLPDEGHEQPTGIVVVNHFSTVDEAELHALVKKTSTI